MTAPALTLSVSIFSDLTSAIAVASRVEEVIRTHHLGVDGVAVVARDEVGRLLLHELGNLPIEPGANRGAVLGTVLGLMFPPARFSSAFLAATLGTLVERVTVDEAELSAVREIGARLLPGQAALVVVGPGGTVDQIVEAHTGYESMVRHDLASDFVTAVAERK
jgi:uncharacterized membrane protein